MPSISRTKNISRQLTNLWNSPRVAELRATIARWQKLRFSGTVVLVIGTVSATLLIIALDATIYVLPTPGLVYLPLVAFLAYYWNWRYAVIATLLQLFCVYLFLISPKNTLKPMYLESVIQLVTLAAVTGFVLAIVQLARVRRLMAEHAAERLTALNRIGTALASELDRSTTRSLRGLSVFSGGCRGRHERARGTISTHGTWWRGATCSDLSAWETCTRCRCTDIYAPS